MQFPYRTKYNGVYYPAFTEIPTDGTPVVEIKTEETVINKEVKEIPIPKALQQPTEIERLGNEVKVFKDIPKFTRTQLARLKADEVKELAIRLKIENVEEKSGAELRRMILKMVEDNYAED